MQEYVVVELDPDQIHWFIRRDDRFEDLPPGPDGIYRSEIFPGLWLDPAALYAEDLDRLIEVLEQGLATPAARRVRRAAGKGTPWSRRVNMSVLIQETQLSRIVNLINVSLRDLLDIDSTTLAAQSARAWIRVVISCSISAGSSTVRAISSRSSAR